MSATKPRKTVELRSADRLHHRRFSGNSVVSFIGYSVNGGGVRARGGVKE